MTDPIAQQQFTVTVTFRVWAEDASDAASTVERAISCGISDKDAIAAGLPRSVQGANLTDVFPGWIDPDLCEATELEELRSQTEDDFTAYEWHDE